MAQAPIAIVGLGCRLPGANNIGEFWKLLLEGGDAITGVPLGRWTEEMGVSGWGPEKTAQIHGGFLRCPIDEFDAKFFGMSPKEVEFVDPQQRLLLEVTWEALEDAAVNPHSLRGTQTGIFTGTWTHDYADLMIKSGFQGEHGYMRAYLGNAYGATAGRLANFYGTTGSTVANESGCSSSMLAVGLACHSLRRKDVNLALACGVNLLLQPFAVTPPLMAADGRCKTFDAAADGFGRAEGCGVLVLKRLADAVIDGDNIRGIIRGYGEAQEGPSRSLGTPTVDVEALAMTLALKDADVEPWEVTYLEAHGTGTAVGDPLEMTAIAKVYTDVRRNLPLIIGSVKPNVGHTESVAGITGIIKTLLAFEHEVIPAHRNLTHVNPKIDLNQIPAVIPLREMPWKRTPNQRRVAGVSSFGFAGTDTHVILEEPPAVPKSSNKRHPLTCHPLALSARSQEALHSVISSCVDYVRSNPQAFDDFVYTWNVSRAKFKEFRAAVVSTDAGDFLEKVKSQRFLMNKGQQRSKICFLFPGQATQFFGMGKELYENSPIFKSNFDEIDRILREDFEIDIKHALWNDSSLLEKTSHSQSSIFAVQVCLLHLWASWGITPDVVVGHSLGEYAAAVAAGILSLNDALRLVAGRAKLLEALPSPGQMIVVKADKKETSRLLRTLLQEDPTFSLEIAAFNSPQQTVVAGTEQNVTHFQSHCSSNNVKSVVLKSASPIHSSLVDDILPEFRKLTQKATFNSPKSVVFVSSAVGTRVNSFDADYFVSGTRNPVNFIGSCATLKNLNEEKLICVDIGPQPVLSALLHQNYAATHTDFVCLSSIKKNESSWRTLGESLASLHTLGVDVNWKEFHDNFHGRRLPGLPSYPFQRKPFWFPVSKMVPGNPNSQLHPLVHTFFPTAADVKIFHTRLILEEVPFLNDHRIGVTVIFPAAAYLEMILAVGHTAFPISKSSEKTNISVSSFSIHSPLSLSSSDFVELQVILSQSKSNPTSVDDLPQTTVEVFRCHDHRSSGKKEWIKHVTATLAIGNCTSPDVQGVPRDLNALIATYSSPIDLNDFYSSLEKVGLVFGPSFRSLQRLWRSDTETFAEVEVPSSVSSLQGTKYFCHPVAIDSILQAIIAATSPEVSNLSVPIHIQKFQWTSSSVEDPFHFFVHVTGLDTADPKAVLLDVSGRTVASMEGLRFKTSSVESVEAALNLSSPDDKKSQVSIFEESWAPSEQPKTPSLPSTFGSLIIERLQDIEDSLQTSEIQDLQLLYKSCSCHIIQAFLQLGWSPSPGEIVEVPKLVSNLNILPNLLPQTRRMLEIIHSSFPNVLSTKDNQTFQILRSFPSALEISEQLLQIRESLSSTLEVEMEALEEFAPSMSSVLRGHTSMVPILFGETRLAERIYTEFSVCPITNDLLAASHKAFEEEWSQISRDSNATACPRVIEIGAGTGGATRTILPHLRESFPNFSYTFTDLSPEFFSRAESTFKDFQQYMKFQALDIEKDLPNQNFIPGHYDLVIASYVLHATSDLRETVKNVRRLLKPNGVALILEHLEPSPIIDTIFGLVEGYWRFQDFHLRPHHCSISKHSWSELLHSCGFQRSKVVALPGRCEGFIVAVADGFSSCHTGAVNTWGILSDVSTSKMASSLELHLLQAGRQAVVIRSPAELSKELQRNKMEGILFLQSEETLDPLQSTRDFLLTLQALIATPLSNSNYPRVILVTTSAVAVGDQSDVDVNPHSATLWAMSRSFRSENPHFHCLNVDVDPQDTVDNNAESLMHSIWSTSEGFVAIRSGQILTPKLTSIQLERSLLTIPPNCARFVLKLPITNNIDDLRFTAAKHKKVDVNCVEVEVRASALNFRDIFSILKPTSDFDHNGTVGSDFSGVVTSVGRDVKQWRVGDEVFGCSFRNGALPSHVIVEEDSLTTLPSNWTFEEGSTVPVVFMTAFHCLIDVARLQKDDVILIHAAAGGVGLAAIQVAKNIGARIIATAGSRRKRAYLQKVAGLTDVLHSRDVSFAKKVKEATDGRGVDVVLNSLTGDGFKEASLSALRHSGRFVEMSKLNIWTTHDVKILRPDVTYTVVELTSVTNDTWTHLVRLMEQHVKNGTLCPLPFDAFEAIDVRAALRHLQKAQAIGKVVCRMPQGGRQLLFDGRSSHLITGGLGGVGLEVAKWMSSEGAKFLILCGRSKPSSVAQDVIDQLRKDGVTVAVVQVDVSGFDDTQRLLNVIKSGHIQAQQFPPLRGIHHCAGTISDSLLQNQTLKSFEEVFQGKLHGAWNLHLLTTSGNFRLESFVLHSSISAIIGLKGQSNYAGANAFLDSLAHLRHSIGLPSTSINWGQWNQIGVGTGIEIKGFTPISPLDALSSLKRILLARSPQVCVCSPKFPQLRQFYPWLFNGYANSLLPESSKTSTPYPNVNSPKAEPPRDSNLWETLMSNPQDVNIIILTLVVTSIKKILKLDVNEAIDVNASFEDLNLDSLMLVELRNELQKALGNENFLIGTSILSHAFFPHKLAKELATLVHEKIDEKETKPVP